MCGVFYFMISIQRKHLVFPVNVYVWCVVNWVCVMMVVVLVFRLLHAKFSRISFICCECLFIDSTREFCTSTWPSMLFSIDISCFRLAIQCFCKQLTQVFGKSLSFSLSTRYRNGIIGLYLSENKDNEKKTHTQHTRSGVEKRSQNVKKKVVLDMWASARHIAWARVSFEVKFVKWIEKWAPGSRPLNNHSHDIFIHGILTSTSTSSSQPPR